MSPAPGLSRRKLNDAQLAEAIALREDRRWSAERIARRFKCSKGTIDWAMLREGVDINAHRTLKPVPAEAITAMRGGHQVRRFTQTEDARMLALEADGISVNRIGLALGRRHNSIIGRLRTLARRAARVELAP